MTYGRYLTGVAATLRSEVAGNVTDTQANDSLGACIRSLALIAATIDAAQAGDPVTAPDLRGLPAELRAALTAPASPAAGLHLAVGAPPEDAPAAGAHGDAIATASDWIRSPAAGAHAELPAALAALCSWSAQQRDAILVRADAIEQGDPAAEDGAHFVNIDPERLAAYLRRHYGHPELAVDQFAIVPGGRSRQTATFTLSGHGQPPEQLVIQREQPAGMIEGSGGPERQFRLLSILHETGVRVPRPVLWEPDPAPLHGAFMIAERMVGATIIDAATEYFATPPARPGVARSLARRMAELHQVPVERAVAILAPEAAAEAPASWRADLETIAARWRALANGPSVTVEAALRWMEANVDHLEERRAIVHTDMLLHNVLVDEHDEVTAILDWEIPHLGHPAEDLGYVRPVLEQMVPWREYMEAYAEAGGPPIAARDIDYFTLRALVHMLTLAQYGRNAFQSGATDDIRPAEIGASFNPRLVDRLGRVLAPLLAEWAAAGRPSAAGAAR